jgi:hypothetical protein
LHKESVAAESARVEYEGKSAEFTIARAQLDDALQRVAGQEQALAARAGQAFGDHEESADSGQPSATPVPRPQYSTPSEIIAARKKLEREVLEASAARHKAAAEAEKLAEAKRKLDNETLHWAAQREAIQHEGVRLVEAMQQIKDDKIMAQSARAEWQVKLAEVNTLKEQLQQQLALATDTPSTSAPAPVGTPPAATAQGAAVSDAGSTASSAVAARSASPESTTEATAERGARPGSTQPAPADAPAPAAYPAEASDEPTEPERDDPSTVIATGSEVAESDSQRTHRGDSRSDSPSRQSGTLPTSMSGMRDRQARLRSQRDVMNKGRPASPPAPPVPDEKELRRREMMMKSVGFLLLAFSLIAVMAGILIYRRNKPK